jgi:hypothetical protein
VIRPPFEAGLAAAVAAATARWAPSRTPRRAVSDEGVGADTLPVASGQELDKGSAG